MLFSATLDYDTKQIASSQMNRPKDVAVKPEKIAAEGIDQMIYHVDRDSKFKLLIGVFSREEVPKGLIFANQKVTVTWLVESTDKMYRVSLPPRTSSSPWPITPVGSVAPENVTIRSSAPIDAVPVE